MARFSRRHASAQRIRVYGPCRPPTPAVHCEISLIHPNEPIFGCIEASKLPYKASQLWIVANDNCAKGIGRHGTRGSHDNAVLGIPQMVPLVHALEKPNVAFAGSVAAEYCAETETKEWPVTSAARRMAPHQVIRISHAPKRLGRGRSPLCRATPGRRKLSCIDSSVALGIGITIRFLV